MAFDFKFPDVGEGITEGTIVKWLVKQGDTVKADEPLAEIETDKAVVEIPSPKAGTVLKITHKVGDVIKVGEVLAVIGEKGEKAEQSDKKKKSSKKTSAGKKSKNPSKKSDEHYTGSVVGFVDSKEVEIDRSPKKAKKKKRKRVKATFKVRKLAKKLGVDIKEIEGTGKDGRITEDDIKHAVHGTKKDHPGDFERTKLKGLRKAIADNLSKSDQVTVPVTNFHDADVTDLWDVRKKKNKKSKAHVTFLPYIIKAVVKALKDHPEVNAMLEEDEIIYKKYYNIGVAVDTDDGLVVPVLNNADKKDLIPMAKELKELGEKARKRKLTLAQMRGGSFTITNLGSIGVKYFTPVINYPEAAILGVGSINDQAVVREGHVVLRKIMPLSLTYDHRIVDGANAARFMADVISYLEDPKTLS